MKVLKHKNIMNLVYAVLIGLPMFAILGRVIYVQSNEKSLDSYYGENINQSENIYLSQNDSLVVNDEYYFQANSGYTYDVSTFTANLYVYDFKLVDYGALTNNEISNINSVVINRVYFTSYNNAIIMQLYYQNGDQTTWLLSTNKVFTFSFNYLDSSSNFQSTLKTYVYKVVYNKYSYLDNAFEYSLYTFVEDNDFGNFNLFTWFENMFLSNSSHNNLYIHFINWYLNYVLLVSLVWVLFLLIAWFVNFARRLLESSFDKSDRLGGF